MIFLIIICLESHNICLNLFCWRLQSFQRVESNKYVVKKKIQWLVISESLHWSKWHPPYKLGYMWLFLYIWKFQEWNLTANSSIHQNNSEQKKPRCYKTWQYFLERNVIITS